MSSQTTRERLLAAAAALFADHGYRGASVRDICDRARANPGAVSYYFSGKRQLYRTVLRQAVERLAAPPPSAAAPDQTPQQRLRALARLIGQRLAHDPVGARLLLRDLSDGGPVAVEALAPALRSAVEGVRVTLGQDDSPAATALARDTVVALGAALLSLQAAWPVLERALGLEPARREEMLDTLLERALAHLAPNPQAVPGRES